MPFGASKVILARPGLRSRVKVTESRRQGFGPALHTALTLRGLRKATAAPSPAHTAACLALPFTSLSGRRQVSPAQCRGACACCQPVGPSSHSGWPSSAARPHAPVPSPQAGAQWPLPRGQCLGARVSCSPCPPFHPPTLGTPGGRGRLLEWHC